MEKWPIYDREKVGNCPFCWGASWGPHEKECTERKKNYQANNTSPITKACPKKIDAG